MCDREDVQDPVIVVDAEDGIYVFPVDIEADEMMEALHFGYGLVVKFHEHMEEVW